MARKLIKRLLPDPEWVKSHPSLQILGDWVHDPNLWHLNRHSVSTATFIGLFVAFIPLPTQMIMAALAAIVFRANLPLAVVLVWTSNPITMAPMFYFCYRIGLLVIGADAGSFDFELSWQWINSSLHAIWVPLLLGCLICGLFFGLLGSALMRFLWRRHTIKRWRERRVKRQ